MNLTDKAQSFLARRAALLKEAAERKACRLACEGYGYEDIELQSGGMITEDQARKIVFARADRGSQ
jgi:hypothetical protein